MSLQEWHDFGWLKPHTTSLVQELRVEVLDRLRENYPSLGEQGET